MDTAAQAREPQSVSEGLLLARRRLLITGVLRPHSLATAIAVLAAQQGAQIILTAPAQSRRLTQLTANKMRLNAPILELDVSDSAAFSALAQELRALGVQRLDGVVHAIAACPPALLGRQLTPQLRADYAQENWQQELQRAFTISTASLAALVGALQSLLSADCSIATLTFASERVQPGYGWMGPLKAALEASVRGLAMQLGEQGVRINAVSCGPIATPAASAIPGFAKLCARFQAQSPLGWDANNPDPIARTVVALLSPWLPATTGQVIYADSGMNLR